MPAINRTSALTRLPRRRLLQSRLRLRPPPRHPLSTTTLRARDSQYYRAGFESQNAGFTGSYEPGRPTEGPLAKASNHGAPRLTPALLKEHLDKYVVGQDKAKKVTSVAIFNHYQRIREIRRLEEEQHAKAEQEARWELREKERNSHPVENEYPGHIETVDLNNNSSPYRSAAPPPDPELGHLPLPEDTRTVIEKSNVLLLGPSGVGKTYILSTLARVLEVPFATVDCSALTQAGYIGTDIESSIERLLLASQHSIQKCETGIIFFDEVDKLAKPAIMTHGRDVSGEGVQQGLLKMIEGTTVTVNAKSDRSSKTEGGREGGRLDRGGRDTVQGQMGKSEQYTIDTTNILFVFAGAFVGLEKIISSRLSSGSSLGFGAQLKTPPSHSSSSKSSLSSKHTPSQPNILDSVTPSDLQTYGLIPELLGRIPITVALTPLNLHQLITILTSPRNSLVKQFTALFNTYGIQLKFTSGALHAIAERVLSPSSSSSHPTSSSASSTSTSTTAASGNGTSNPIGARGLRSILESLLSEIMFHGPGSAIRFCLVDESFVRSHFSPSSTSSLSSSSSFSSSSKNSSSSGDVPTSEAKMPRCWSRGQSRAFEEAWEREEEAWKDREAREKDGGEKRGGGDGVEQGRGFERFRRVGSSGM
ncbi:hypothetical protein ONS96_007415 [Cadophora gregata f. sp. sojae]|nr:hypothetical protein ONS96_007415 [Cadophora gregata f. sp. sojae]